MIPINKSQGYLQAFSNQLEIYLYEELTQAIKNKQVVTPKNNKLIVSIEDNKDIKCLEYLKDNIKKIIQADIKEQINFIKYLESNCQEISKKYGTKEKKPPLYQAVKYIFVNRGYESKISTTVKNSIAYKFVEKLDLKTCPYCNRNYISYIEISDGNTKKTRPQLDHFYPKTIYPFLACSFYNLIPSCTTCNHIKSDDDSFNDKLINPYEIQENDFIFSYTLNNLDVLEKKYLNYNDEHSIDIIFNKKINSNEEYFQLETLYQNHKDIVLELIIKKQYYPTSYINDLSKLGFSKDEIYRYIFSNYVKTEDLHKRPLSKLIKDISEELKLI